MAEMRDALAAVARCSAAADVDEELGLLVCWNGETTFNVFSLESGDCVHAFQSAEPLDLAAAQDGMRGWLRVRRDPEEEL